LSDDTEAEPATAAASGGDDTAAAPTDHATELIETGAAPRPELAWSAATDEQRRRPSARSAAERYGSVP
jgi:hypothetical protein